MLSTLRMSLVGLVLLSSETISQDWQPLFTGHSLAGWTTQDGSPVTAAAWKVEPGGVLHLDTSIGRGGNIVTDRDYGDFELVFEWMISEGGNNGIKYRVNDFNGRTLGCEYQLIDDHNNQLKPIHKTASLYDVYEPVEHGLLKPYGQWNRGRILVVGNTLEHWLNGHLVMSAEVGSQEWDERIGESKFNDVEDFGRTPRGKIMLTDHRDEVWYRNVFLRELSPGFNRTHEEVVCRTKQRATCCERTRRARRGLHRIRLFRR